MNRDLTNSQNDYSIFLPATSGFYATFIGKQRYGNYVDPARIPSSFKSGVESLNYLNPDHGQFYYKWCLYSAGHANLDLNKADESEDMFRNRDRSTSWVLGDSGGFQIGKGVWEADWKDPNCPKAQKKREQVLAWLDTLMDCSMGLDIPSWVVHDSKASQASGITTVAEAISATKFNNEFFMYNRRGKDNGGSLFLNVLQGDCHANAELWYQTMKDYCDPKKYPDVHFDGWAMGGQNMCDVHLVLKRIVALRFDGLLEQGIHDWMHFLGTSKLEWACLLTDIQRAVRKYHNPNFTISFDCASPFLATANGQIYIYNETRDRKKWIYRMTPSVDDKSYALDTRLFKDGVIQDGIFTKFESSPIIDQVTMKDVCIYSPGDLNKIGKEGKTSWDSFSYAIQMGHNVWAHINAVQEANRQYDNGKYPGMLVASKYDGKQFSQYNHNYFKDIIEEIFATSNKGDADKLIEEYYRYWMDIPGTRGLKGKKTISNVSTLSKFFKSKIHEIEEPLVTEDGEFSELAIQQLDKLEEEIHKDAKKKTTKGKNKK